MNPNISAIKLGVSSCLLGNEVRYDGGHKRNAFVTHILRQYFEFVAICPEVAIGMGIPREPIRLVGDPLSPKAVGVRDLHFDVTVPLVDFSKRIMPQLHDISGYILKKNSPSCGMERVKVYDKNSVPTNSGRGIFARELMHCYPCLPVEEDGRLMDPNIRENFIERVFIYHRWQQIVEQGLTPAALVRFHTDHKYAILSRGQKGYRELGRLVAQSGTNKENFLTLTNDYISLLMTVMSERAKRGHHANVLMHMMGYLRKRLAKEDKAELLHHIDNYRKGVVPLVVPVTLLRHYLRRFPDAYLQRQHYLKPYPEELKLRNH